VNVNQNIYNLGAAAKHGRVCLQRLLKEGMLVHGRGSMEERQVGVIDLSSGCTSIGYHVLAL
jgi:hypothetical protein